MLNDIQKAAQEQFDKQSARYGKSHILSDTEDVERALTFIPADRPRGCALDIATGAGHTALFLASVGYTVTACDISAGMLQQLAQTAKERDLPITRNQHPAEELPYATGTFDLVTSRVAPHHFSDQLAFVQESSRVLIPGGHFILIDGSVVDDDIEAAEWIHQVEIKRDPSHFRFLPRKTWIRFCEDAGLEVIQAVLDPFKQPDLDWYFSTAATSEENRRAVRQLIQTASPHIRSVYRLSEEEGKIVWWWSRLLLIARKTATS